MSPQNLYPSLCCILKTENTFTPTAHIGGVFSLLVSMHFILNKMKISKVSGVIDSLEGRDAIQGDLDSREVGQGEPHEVQHCQVQGPARESGLSQAQRQKGSTETLKQYLKGSYERTGYGLLAIA